MHRPAALAALLVLSALAGTGAGCRSDDKPAPTVVALAGQTVPTEKLLTVAAGICDAAREAGSDLNAARQTFYGQSHEGLHLIARGLEDIDRDASAALLEAKQKVEADFLAPSPGTQAVTDLRRLAAATRSSLARFKVNAGSCPHD